MDELEATRRIGELVDALQQAQTQEELERILAEMKELAMDRLGVKGTA